MCCFLKVVRGSVDFQVLSRDGTKAFNVGCGFVIELMREVLVRSIQTFLGQQVAIIEMRLHLVLRRA